MMCNSLIGHDFCRAAVNLRRLHGRSIQMLQSSRPCPMTLSTESSLQEVEIGIYMREACGGL